MPVLAEDVTPLLSDLTPAPQISAFDDAGATVITRSPAQLLMEEGLENIQDGVDDLNYDDKKSALTYFKIAIPKLKRAINLDPTLVPAWEGLGWAYWHLGRPDESITLWKRLETLDPDLPRVHKLLAQAYAARGDLELSGTHYNKSLELDPDQYETSFAYARVQRWRGYSQESTKLLRTLLREHPDRLDVRIELARTLLASREYEEALEQWAYAREAAPDNLDFRIAESKALLHIGDMPAAEEGAMEVLKQEHKQDPAELPELKREQRTARMNAAIRILADSAEFGMKPPMAAERLKDLIDQTDDPNLEKQLMVRLIRIDMYLYNDDPTKYDLDEPISIARDILTISPLDVNTHLLLAEMLMSDQQYTAAENKFKEVLDKYNPRNRRAFEGLFELSLALQRTQDAEHWYREIEKFDPDDYFKFHRLARLELAKGDYYSAMQALNRLEEEGACGSVFVMLYHGLTPSEWTALPSVRRFREQLLSLRKVGFDFITPDLMPSYFEAQPEPPMKQPKPFLRRSYEASKYAVTGERTKQPSLREFTPRLTACVTFDDALRSSFRWGTPVARELNIPFAMNIPVGNILNYDVRIASWGELRKYQDTGLWVMGSHLVDASTPEPVDEEGYKVYPLANRIWLPIDERLETIWEFHVRNVNEYRLSRKLIDENLGLGDSQVKFVAYPMGDIGQETYCNVDNAILGNLNEAELNYDIGFRQTRHGYTMKKENPLLYQRHEVDRLADGQDVVKFAFENHPVYLARVLRAQTAALQGKLYLAQDMIDELERDNYPDDLLDELKEYVWTHLSRATAAPKHSTKDAMARQPDQFRLAEPRLGITYEFIKDSEETENWRLLVLGGLNLTSAMTVELRLGIGRIKQNIEDNVSLELTETETSTKLEQTTKKTTTNGKTVTEKIDETIVTTEDVTIYTNRIDHSTYDADEQNVEGTLTYQFKNGSLLSFDAGMRSYSSDGKGTNGIDGQSAFVYGIERQWKPTLAVDAVARYEHDVSPAAMEFITYDMVALTGVWRVRDWWDILGTAHYYMMSDDNSMIHLGLNNTWLLSERQGFYFGFRTYFSTADEERQAYWTPYWLQRYFLVGEFRKHYQRSVGQLQLRIGMGKEKAREEDIERYNERRVRGEAQDWYPGENPEKGWEPIVGLSASIKRDIGRHWDIYGQLSVNFLKAYSERNLRLGLLYDF